LRIVGDQFKDGMSGHYSNEFFVLADMHKYADLSIVQEAAARLR
jgi:hypothetical protein